MTQHGGGSRLRILVVEDDAETSAYLQRGLSESGHLVDHARTAEEALPLAMPAEGEMAEARPGGAGNRGSYDVLVVDRMLPGLDGLAMVARLRAAGGRTPVLFLSALGEVDHRVQGLKAGGDDYLAKPFAFRELLARIEALGRRVEVPQPQTRLAIGDLEIDLLSRRVTRGGQRIELQPREFRLLEFLARNAGRVVTRTMLLEGVWNYHFDPQTNVIDVHISRLRAKIDKGFERPLLHTVRGSGYRLADEVAI